jgi:hypothetical protein
MGFQALPHTEKRFGFRRNERAKLGLEYTFDDARNVGSPDISSITYLMRPLPASAAGSISFSPKEPDGEICFRLVDEWMSVENTRETPRSLRVVVWYITKLLQKSHSLADRLHQDCTYSLAETYAP